VPTVFEIILREFAQFCGGPHTLSHALLHSDGPLTRFVLTFLSALCRLWWNQNEIKKKTQRGGNGKMKEKVTQKKRGEKISTLCAGILHVTHW